MPAQGSGTAGSDRPQDASLFRCHFTEPMSMSSHDLCQFQRRTRALEQVRHDIGVWLV
jgi:hypothetical protein